MPGRWSVSLDLVCQSRLGLSFSAEELYNQWLFCEKWLQLEPSYRSSPLCISVLFRALFFFFFFLLLGWYVNERMAVANVRVEMCVCERACVCVRERVCMRVWERSSTGWRRHIECLLFTGHFPQKSSIISGSFAKNDCNLSHPIGLRPSVYQSYLGLSFFFFKREPSCFEESYT